ncbi:MAG: phosphoglycerate mutase family protein [Sneathiella sp.]
MFQSKRLYTIALLFAAGAFLTSCVWVQSPPGTTTTVILLRHAEQADPEFALTEQGFARSQELHAALEDLDIDVIYSPAYDHNLQTIQPLVEQREITLQVIKPTNVALKIVHDNPGKTVLWVGNEGNLKATYRQLGGRDAPPLAYGEILIMTIAETGPPEIETRRFGPAAS